MHKNALYHQHGNCSSGSPNQDQLLPGLIDSGCLPSIHAKEQPDPKVKIDNNNTRRPFPHKNVRQLPTPTLHTHTPHRVVDFVSFSSHCSRFCMAHVSSSFSSTVARVILPRILIVLTRTRVDETVRDCMSLTKTKQKRYQLSSADGV